MNRELKLTESYFIKINNKINYFILPMMLIALIGGFVIGMEDSEINVSIIIIAATILIVGYLSLNKAKKMQKSKTESYTLIIDDERIVRSQDGFGTIEIKKEEISEIIEYEGGSVVIKSDGENKEITIPKEIESFEELKSTLHQWSQIELRSSSKIRNNVISLSIVGLGSFGFLIFLWSQNYYVVLVSGFILLVIFIIGWFASSKINRNSKSKQRFAWWFLFPIIIICIKMYSYIIYG